MITRIKADLLEWPEGINVIGHCCNQQAKMGSGLALGIRNKYPVVASVDYIAYNTRKNILGEYSRAEVEPGKTVYNLYCQTDMNRRDEPFVRKVNYEALYLALYKLHNHLCAENSVMGATERILGLPALLGCGLAGGDVRILNAMIDVIYEKSPLKLYMVEYNK